MCVKLPPGNLNSGPCPPHPTSTYTCRVIIAPKVCGGYIQYILKILTFVTFNKRKTSSSISKIFLCA